MGKASREKRDRKMVKEAIKRLGPEIDATGYQRGFTDGVAQGLQDAADLGTIAKVRAAAKEATAESQAQEAVADAS
jgi:hypothetical protein